MTYNTIPEREVPKIFYEEVFKLSANILKKRIEETYNANKQKHLTKTEKRWLLRLMPIVMAEINTTDCKTARNKLTKLTTTTQLQLERGKK